LSDAEIAALPGAQGKAANGRPRGVTSIAALVAAGDSSKRAAGLLVDEWVETIPNDQVTTGIALQYDAPGAQAPQAVLLAVPAQVGKDGGWTAKQVRDIVRDTADLVPMRLVDPDALVEVDDQHPGPPIGAILPALFMPADAKQPDRREVPPLALRDLTAALKNT